MIPPRIISVFVAFGLAVGGAAQAADGVAGPYLAGRVASLQYDYAAAATYFTQSLVGDPTNVSLMENAILAQIGLGQFDAALTMAKSLDAAGVKNGLADLAVLANLAKQGQFDAAIAELDKGRSAGPLVDGLFRGWAKLGAGQMSEATAAFNDVAKQKGLGAFALYHKALALALVGDFEGADKILSGDEAGPLRATRRSVIAHAQVLSQLERNKAAIELIDKLFGTTLDPEIAAMHADLVAGKTLPFTLINSPADGLAEVFYSVATALAGDVKAGDPATNLDMLMFARAAIYLRPDLTEAVLLAAGNLELQGQHAMAISTYELIESGKPAYVAAALGRAEALIADGRSDAAIEALQQLATAQPDLIEVWVSLGDTLRRAEKFVDAITAYDRAVALIEKPGPDHWVIFYARGICLERQKAWDKAEADFRKALALSPDQAQVLNYLGYSYLEKNTNLDEAMSMIERAAKARPDEGAIIDSLGWALYRLGRYPDAEVQMETAIQLMPVDSVVNDHLGDVYWAVGRKREAEFQWKRALSFKPETEEESARIRRKLAVGLDAVLQEEGAKPLTVGTNGG